MKFLMNMNYQQKGISGMDTSIMWYGIMHSNNIGKA